MANEFKNSPENETSVGLGRVQGSGVAAATMTGHELDAFLGKAFEEKSAFASLFESVHELFFPTKLPPLELTSTPIPVADPMAVKWSPVSVAISALLNAGIVAILLFAFRNQINQALPKSLQLTSLDANVSVWKPVTKKAGDIGGGGGGGSREIVNPIKGHLPKIDPKPLLQPQVAVNPNPKLAIEPAIDVQKDLKLPDNPNLPNIGVTQSPNVTLASNGQGSNGGMGTGSRGGIGAGNGNGLGPGTGGNVSGGVRKVGDGVTAPKVIYSVDAEFSDEARRAKYEGAVLISLIVDAQGNPQSVRVVRSVGMGLDEKAMEAVRQYKFKPAVDQKSGKPVPVEISFLVNFRLY
jgi:TonB family protein